MLQINDIKKEYKTGGLIQKALDGVSLNFRDSEFVAILGPSGSGKTTLLNIIGGLDRYDSGNLIINGISTKKYKDKDWDSYRNHTIGFVFQSYNLIPHQNVLANVELALTISGISRAERRRRAQEALEKVGLGEQSHKLPSQMSGGQMQRVAIARALVNDPDILLADEPTGALDSDTSVQVMELLKEVASDRLVIMVTHNPELAEQYATRIVNLKDGRITADSHPFEPEADSDEAPVHRNMGRSSMSFFTALQLSFNNLLTKKARTLLVAFAGSIGIIGIALILSLSNGVNKYIADIEEDTLSEYPMEITSTSFSLASLMGRGGSSDDDDEEKKEVTEIKTITSLLSKMSSNDLASLKVYLESDNCNVYDYAKHIRYSYNVLPLVYQETDRGIKQVNPYSVLSAFDNGMSSFYSSMSSFSMSMTEIFHEMPDNDSLYKAQYEVRAGRWPEKYNECLLVLTENGFVSDLALYAMNMQDDSALDAAVKNYMSGGELDMEDDGETGVYNYDDFVGVTFKLVNAFDCYSYDPQYNVWTSKTENTQFMKQLVENSEDLTIVGVVSQSKDSNTAMLNTGINYTFDLTEHIIDMAAGSDLVKAQLTNPSIDVLTGKPFGEDTTETLDMSSLFSIDEDALKDAFSLDTDSINTDMPDIPLDESMFDNISLGEFAFDESMLENISPEDIAKAFDPSQLDTGDMDLNDLIDPDALAEALPDISREDIVNMLNSVRINLTEEDLTQTARQLTDGFAEYTKDDPAADISKLPSAISGFLETEEARTIITEELREALRRSISDTIDREALQALMSQISGGYNAWAEANGKTDVSQFSEYLAEYLASDEVLDILSSAMAEMLTRAADNIDQADLSKIADELNNAYKSYAAANDMPDLDNVSTALRDYISSDEAEQIIKDNVLSKVDTSELEKQIDDMVNEIAASYSGYIQGIISEMISSYSQNISDAVTKAVSSYAESLGNSIAQAIGTQLKGAMSSAMASIQQTISSSMQSYMGDIASQFENAFSFDPDAFKNAISMNMDEREMSELLSSLMSTEKSTYDKNLKAFGYADREKPYEILIYPRNFESKDSIVEILDDYNKRMEESGQEEKVITYTDMVGTLMSSITIIINAISYVLIAFVSISLIVSSIMIGVITYISVLERRKEIGILRSIGASKHNISSVFNAETIITGLLAGILGTGITMLLLIPANIILRKLTGQQNLAAFLPVTSALILIGLSVVLTLIGGLIPSRKAAASDPVSALRNE